MVALVVTYYGVAATSQDAASTALIGRHQAAIVLWLGIAIFAALGIVPRANWSLGAKVSTIGFAALVSWTGASLFWTESVERSSIELARVVGLAGVALAVLLVSSTRNWRSIAYGLFVGAATVVLIALAALLAPDLFGGTRVRAAFAIDRFSFPLGYWNSLGAWTAMTAVFALGVSAGSRRPIVRGLAAAMIPVTVLVWQFTLSRAALVGVAIGLLALISLSKSRVTLLLHLVLAVPVCGLLAFQANSHLAMSGGLVVGDSAFVTAALAAACVVLGGAASLTSALDRADPMSQLSPSLRRSLGAAGALVVLVIVAWTASQYGPRAFDEFTGSTQAPAAQTSGSELSPMRLTYLNGNRHNIWTAAWNGFESDPLIGSGPGTFEFTWTSADLDPEPVLDAHSLYLETLTESGLIGAIFLATLIGGLLLGALLAIRNAARSDRTMLAALLAVLAVFLVQAGLDWMWEATAVSALALAVGAAAVGSLGDPIERAESRRWVRIALCVAGLLAAFVQLPGLRTATDLETSRAAVRRGNLGAAAEAANAAVSSAPWSTSAIGQRGLVSELRGDPEAAIADFELAESREPRNWRWPLYLATSEALAGNDEAARTAYRRARSLKPQAFIFAKEPK